MKKVLALFLALAMLVTLNVGALADDGGIEAQASEVPIRVSGMAPGQTVRVFAGDDYYVNTKNTIFLRYVADYPITSIRFTNSVLTALMNPDNNNQSEQICVSVTLPNPYEDIFSQGFGVEDTMTVSLANGKDYVFPIEIIFNRVSKAIRLKVTDENGADISQYEDEHGQQEYPFPVGGSVKFTVEVLDDAKISKPPYHIQLKGQLIGSTSSLGDSLEDYYKISAVTMIENGTKGQFTLTNLGDPSDAYYYGRINLTISLWDESVDGNQDTKDTRSFKFFSEQDLDNPDKPSKPDKPGKPDPDKTPVAPPATDNAANDDRTIADLASGEDTEVKLTNGSAGLSADTINALGGHGSRLTIVNGGMSVNFPNGFTKVTEPGRIYYPFDYEEAPIHAADMLAAVKGVGVKSEARKVGGSMTLPGTASVTLKTKLDGNVNVYLYDEDTGKFTLVASPVAKDGTVTFPTRQMGYMVVTTGRV